jgi:putative hemolysin
MTPLDLRTSRAIRAGSIALAAAGILISAESAFAIANPASVFCVSRGGKVEIVRDKAGNERGICVLPNGERVDEWAFYRKHAHRPRQ